MLETAVTDTGPLLHLAEIGQEGLLRLFERVIASEQVAAEARRFGVLDRITSALGCRLVIERVTDGEVSAQREVLDDRCAHQTDLSVAALAARSTPDVVLTDDLTLRKGLEAQGCQVVGSVGILVRAFRAGRVSKSDLHVSLERLFDGSSLYLSKSFRAHVRSLLDDID